MFFDYDNTSTVEDIHHEQEVSEVDTIIISDIHLGSLVSRSHELVALLKRYRFKRLILNGDVFDDLNFKRLKKKDWKFLSLIRSLSHPRHGREVIWVIGNHDGIAESLSHLLGVEVVEEYLWIFNQKKMLALHGHQFDEFIVEKPVITEVATRIYTGIQMIDGGQQRLSRWIKQRSKRFIRIVEKVADDALEYGRNQQVDYVFCGHTHVPAVKSSGGVTYVNSGCWTDVPSTFVTIDNVHGVRIRTCSDAFHTLCSET
ncbi:MAG: UDP-2,3-diacylglucosamine diphosphatase [Candidatus Kapaibacterium sp.]|jgi:UDP-2,3-diacylglucosamine pyrophosphatase LpxH